jgi:hypothetical protein
LLGAALLAANFSPLAHVLIGAFPSGWPLDASRVDPGETTGSFARVLYQLVH